KSAGLTMFAKGGLRRRHVSRNEISDHTLRRIERAEPIRLSSENPGSRNAFETVPLNVRAPIWNKHHMASTEPITSAKTQNVFQIGTKRLESLMQGHQEILGTFEQVQRERLTRTMEETRLASEFAARVTGARSIPDIMAIYQQWIAKCEE